MGNSAVVELKDGLVVLGNEESGVIADNLTNPDVVIIVGVFNDLGSRPRFFNRIPFLLRDGS